MIRTTLDAVRRHVGALAATGPDVDRSDGQLLRAFLDGRDEAAFGAIVQRHGALVLGVCRRVVRHEQEAEDACQATFLVLARNASSIRKQESLASWLHGAAYQMANSARKAASRRRKHEGLAEPARPADPAWVAAWREVQVVLDEEIGRLPAIYREPFILCCLENHSCEEAAARLGQKKGTVWSRLARARERLQKRLARRGVSLTAVLAGVALAAGRSAALSGPLASSTARAAALLAADQALTTNLVPARVVALLQGAQKTMFLNKLKAVTALAVLAGVFSTGAIAAVQKGASAKAVPSDTAAKGLPATAGVKIRGRVLGPDGKAFAGADLYLVASDRSEEKNPTRATSGADGRFEITLPKSNRSPGRLAALAKGHGFDWAVIGGAESSREVVLRLVKDVPIRGRILDRDGRPVAGAKVRVVSVTAYRGEDLSPPLEEFLRIGWWRSSGVKSWAGPLPGQARVLTVGADGHFRLAGFGRERTVQLLVEGPAIEHSPITVMTRASNALAGGKPLKGYRQAKLHGAEFDYLAAPSRPIRGVVRDKATGKPVAGVTFWSYLTNHRPVTDAKGRYELLGHPKTPAYTLYLVPPDGRHFAIRVQVKDTQGLDPLTADIALPAGIPVRGRVRDKASGKPVAGVRVSYFVLYPNPKVGKLDGYHEHEGLSSATTGTDGSYSLSVLPGPGVLAAAAASPSSYRAALIPPKEVEDLVKARPPFPNQDSLAVHATGAAARAQNLWISQLQYNALSLINPGEKDTKLVRDLTLLPPLTRKGTVVGPDGKPLAGVTVLGLGGPHSDDFKTGLKSASFTVQGLHPLRSRELFFLHKEKNLGRYLELRGEDSKPLKVEMQLCGSVAGRLVDKGGKPVVGTVIYFCRKGYGAFFPGGFHVKTDADGRFAAEGLVPGQKYTLTRYTTNIADTLPRAMTVESGKKKDLGDLVVAPTIRD